MPLDVQNVLHARIKALLLGYPPLMALVKAGNFITADEKRPGEKDAAKSGPGDYPKIRIIVAEDTSNDRPQMPFNDDPDEMDLPVPMTLNVDVRIVHDQTSLNGQTPIEAAVRGALHSKGRTLDLDWVGTSFLRGVKRRDENSAETGNTLRTVSASRLVVTAAPLRSDLISL